jgi:hypothetical protein
MVELHFIGGPIHIAYRRVRGARAGLTGAGAGSLGASCTVLVQVAVACSSFAAAGVHAVIPVWLFCEFVPQYGVPYSNQGQKP